ncbi:hypothetical protein BH11PSE12_BH11PSE12_17430 [soil metagenome]
MRLRVNMTKGKIPLRLPGVNSAAKKNKVSIACNAETSASGGALGLILGTL